VLCGMGSSGIGICLTANRAMMKFIKARVLLPQHHDKYALCSVLAIPVKQNNYVATQFITCSPIKLRKHSFSPQLVFNQCIITFIKPKCSASEILNFKCAWKPGPFFV